MLVSCCSVCCSARSTVWPANSAPCSCSSAAAYATYYSAFLVYDNLLSFSLVAFYDLAVVALVVVVATRRLSAR